LAVPPLLLYFLGIAVVVFTEQWKPPYLTKDIRFFVFNLQLMQSQNAVSHHVYIIVKAIFCLVMYLVCLMTVYVHIMLICGPIYIKIGVVTFWNLQEHIIATHTTFELEGRNIWCTDVSEVAPLSQSRQAGKWVDKSQSWDINISHSMLLVAGT
jgi:hypothetical protein